MAGGAIGGAGSTSDETRVGLRSVEISKAGSIPSSAGTVHGFDAILS